MLSSAAVTATFLSLLSAPGQANIQAHEAHSEPLRTMLVAPEDGIAYREARLRAWMLLGAENGVEAEPLASQLTRDYPRDPENWFLLAQAKRFANKPAEAASAYEKVISMVGWNPVAFVPQTSRWVPMVLAAGQHVAAGKKRAALDLLWQGVFEHHYPFSGELYDEPALSPLREDPEFLTLVGRPDTSSWSRDYGWRQDVEHLYRLALRVRPVSRDNPIPAEFTRRYEALTRDVPRLSDEQILVGMNGMLAALRQGHTALWGLGGSRIAPKALPLQFWLFPDGLFVIGAHDRYKDLVGARVLKIGDTPIEDALRLVSSIQSADGDMEYVLGAPNLMRGVPFLKGLGIVDGGDAFALMVETPGRRRRTVSVATPAWRASSKLVPPPAAKAPVFLRNSAHHRWERPMPRHDAHYVQLNNIFNGDGETLVDFGVRLRRLLADGAPRNLILDLRHNDGGVDTLYRELLKTLVSFSQKKDARLYVLIGRTTYSAAAALITDLERLASPIFVGEASSECCAFFGNPTPVYLPYSRITGSMSAVRWNLSHEVFDRRREMSPHVPVQLTARDYFAGRDPVLDAVFRMIEKERAEASGVAGGRP